MTGRDRTEEERFEDAGAKLAASPHADPWSALLELADGSPERLSTLEAGAVNAWSSVGPLRLWRSGQDHAFEGTVGALLERRPELALCHVPVAFEIGYASPRSS